MTRARLRSLPVLALAGIGWALLVLVYAPAVLGLLPVRIIVGDAVILPTGGCVQRVSTRGVIHAPDSPHWAQTGTARCLDQE